MNIDQANATAADTATDVTLSEVLARVSTIARGVAAPRAEEVDRAGIWPEHTVRALLDAGLGGLVVARRHGGLGHGLFAVARVCEILGEYCSSSALCYGMHLVGSAVLSAKATPAQQREYLAAINRGIHLTTLALSEPGTGAHFYLPMTEMQPASAGFFRLRGAKSFVTNGGHADSYVVSTVGADPDAPAGQFSCVVVPADSPGMQWSSDWEGLGMRGNSSRSVRLEDVEVPEGNLLGEPGDQIWYVFEVVAPYFLMAMAGTYLGIAQAAFNAARDHLAGRTYEHSGTTVGRSPVLQHRLGALWSRLEATRRLIYHASTSGDAEPESALLAVLSAKAEIGEVAVQVANEAMTLAGGIAYRESGRLARCLRDARAAHVMAPTTDLLRLWTGRALLGQPLLSE